PPAMKSRAALALITAAAIGSGCDREPPAQPGSASPSAAARAAATGSDLGYDDLVALIGNPDHFAIARTLGERLPTLGPRSVPAVKQVIDDAANLEIDGVTYELLMRYWALHEPEEAAFYALARAPRGYRVAAIHATLRPWAKLDPEKALKVA